MPLIARSWYCTVVSTKCISEATLVLLGVLHRFRMDFIFHLFIRILINDNQELLGVSCRAHRVSHSATQLTTDRSGL
jgi:hypothetical protein